jgi:hypothetical protein
MQKRLDMDPLSAWTSCRRHRWHTTLLVGAIGLVTVALYLVVALSWAIFVEPMRSNRMFLSRFSVVMPQGEDLTAAVAAQIRASPDVAQIVPVVLSQGFSVPQLVGDGSNWLAFVSLEFLESHESYPVVDDALRSVIVVPKAGRKSAMDDWLESTFSGTGIRATTWRGAVLQAQARVRGTVLTFALIEGIVAITTAIVLAVLNHIAAVQRQSEFGLLHALGHGRRWLAWRVIGETTLTAGMAWGISATLCLVLRLYLHFGVFTSMGLRLDWMDPTPWIFTLPIPALAIAVTAGTMARTLAKLDAVSIIERRA